MGNASFGSDRPKLEPGDYIAEITGVTLSTSKPFVDGKRDEKGKDKPTFTWHCTLTDGEGEETDQDLYTSRVISDMKKVKDPQYVSGLNKLIRACGEKVPQTAEDVEDWEEESLVGCRFLWRVIEEEDDESGMKTRKRKLLRLDATERDRAEKHAKKKKSSTKVEKKNSKKKNKRDDDDDMFADQDDEDEEDDD